MQGPNDAFNEFYGGSTIQGLTTFDMREMDVLGLNRVDDFANNVSTTATLAVNGSATGNIQAGGDHDWFRINLTAGVHYRFDNLGSPTGNGTNTDTNIALYDSSGTSQHLHSHRDNRRRRRRPF